MKHLRFLLVPSLVALAACTPATDVNIDIDATSSTDAMMESSRTTGSSADAMDSSESTESSDAMMPSSAEMDDDSAMQGEARVITISVKNWEFSQPVVNVKKGEKVTLRFTSETGNHGVAIPGVKVNAYLPLGETVDVALDTSAAGTYDGFCNVPCGPGHRDMKFQIVVS